uniref:Putative secreted peptide n=1 Tax=Anopheles braziliensis TaxID=58242 RepID=A0A2M3ZX36_9DIPT
MSSLILSRSLCVALADNLRNYKSPGKSSEKCFTNCFRSTVVICHRIAIAGHCTLAAHSCTQGRERKNYEKMDDHTRHQ